MKITTLNHFNLTTSNLNSTRDFYTRVLNFEIGHRPNIPFDGLWLYLQEKPVLHVSARPAFGGTGPIDHVALNAVNLPDALRRLKSENIEYHLLRQSETGIWQIFISDPNGAIIELDFDSSENLPNEK